MHCSSAYQACSSLRASASAIPSAWNTVPYTHVAGFYPDSCPTLIPSLISPQHLPIWVACSHIHFCLSYVGAGALCCSLGLCPWGLAHSRCSITVCHTNEVTLQSSSGLGCALQEGSPCCVLGSLPRRRGGQSGQRPLPAGSGSAGTHRQEAAAHV